MAHPRPSQRLRSLFLGLILLAGTAARATSEDDARSLFAFATQLKQSRQYLLASVYFGWLAHHNESSSLRWASLEQYSLLMDRLDQKDEAARALMLGLESSNNPRLPEFQLLAATRGLYAKERLASSEAQKYAAWEHRHDRAPDSDTPELAELRAALRRESRRSVPFGMVLSAVLPGAGQAYLGDIQAAGLAFLVNALFGLATYQLFDKDLPYVGAASGLVFSITYTGNILNVLKITQRRKENLRRRIDTRMLDDVLFPVGVPNP